MIVNELEALSQTMHWKLKKKAPTGVPVYQQSSLQKDVWEILDGDKDDFLIYDRCGLLTFHIVLPNSFLQNADVENAITATYTQDICNCSVSTNSIQRPADEPENVTTTLEASPNDSRHEHAHHHHPHHQHLHHHHPHHQHLHHHHPHHQHLHHHHPHLQQHSKHQNDDSY
uniref:Selenoprotein P N-terminal domain-containing protein n=1 Tax=Oryzias latipes TaxID=8090 RepID=H2MB78_ORYLA